MNSGRNDCQRISRRVVFPGTALALGAAAAATVVSEATAQEKISQADAKYQGTPKDDQRCDGCILFQPPNTCKVVKVKSARAAGASCLSRRRSPLRIASASEQGEAARLPRFCDDPNRMLPRERSKL